MLLSKCAIRDSEKWRFIKAEEANGLLSSLGIKTPLSKIPSQFHWIILKMIILLI